MSRPRRRRLIGTSLKMYMGLAQTRAWVEGLAAIVRGGDYDAVDQFVIPNALSLAETHAALRGTRVALGAQNVFWEDAGPYTGEVSAPMLVEAHCRYVEIGHTERRRLFGETDETIARKMAAAVRAGLIPLLCVGEEQPGSADAAVQACLRQVDAAMAGLAGAPPLVVAYEPVWAIGADRPADPGYIAAVAEGLQAVLGEQPDVRLIYGGSAGPGLLSRLGPSVDGLFLGRFVHDVSKLKSILEEAKEAVLF